MKSIKVEFAKSKLPLMLAISLATALLQFLWMNAAFLSAGPDASVTGWVGILYDLPLINMIVLPIYIAVIASIPAELEHKVEMPKLLFTLQPRTSFYHAKLILGFLVCAAFILTQTIFVILTGTIHHFLDTFLWKELLLYQISSLLITYAGYLFHFFLSLRFTHQVVTLAVGIISSLIGTFLVFFDAPVLYHLFLWSNYASLSLCQMNYDSATRVCTYQLLPFDWFGILAGICWLVLSYLCGRRSLRKMV